MENTYKISGRLIDGNNKPLPDLEVKALKGSFLRDKKLGNSTTNINGEFEIIYSAADQNSSLDKDIKLEISIENEPLMAISPKKEIIDNNLDLGSVEIHDVNIGVEGRIIDENGDPISGLTVIAEDVDFGKMELNALNLIESKFKSIIKEEGILNESMEFINDRFQLLFPFRDDYLGNAVTDENGYYHIIYPPGKYREIADKDPDIRIIVKDKLGVFELRRTNVYEDVSDVIKCIDKITINRAEMEGWFVTLKNIHKSRFTENNSFEILIDNKNALEKIVGVIEEAESYIYLTQFEFYPDFIPQFLLNNDNEFKPDDTLTYKLLEAQNRGTDVKIIINENAIVPDNYDELKDYFKESKVEVRRFPAKGPYAMHAKVLVADGEKAFVIGSPFVQSYWDTDKHIIDEPRRLNKNEGPLHDVSIYLEGSVIEHIEEFFTELWNYLSDLHFNGSGKISKDRHLNEIKKVERVLNKFEDSKTHLSNYQNELNNSKNTVHNNPCLRMENEPIQIVRSITPNTVNEKGEKGILEAYRRGITNAKDFIYLENQYFTNKYIIGALKKVLENNPDLQLIMLINEVPDVPTYRSWQHYGFEFMGLDLQKTVLEHPQIGVFAKWSGGFENGKNKMRNCYIHSKVAVVDDVWATTGTSNLDGSSLSCAEEFGSQESSVNHLNMEMNALFFDFNEPKRCTIAKFREKLWNEHLGMNITDLTRPQKGWLDLWNKTANDNIKKLEKEEFTLYGGILPYSAKKNAKEQINDLIEQYRRLKGRFNR